MHIPQLISDLAILMMTAGIITIAFKKIKQPLILGYILAGFLLSPYIMDNEGISTWSEIGIVFLMFHLGLDFNMHKLAQVGSTGFLTCAVNLLGMLGIGYATGMALGFSVVDSLVLGGMLSMSSTMVIIKVFEEKKIKNNAVFATLVIQDIIGIFMMVVMSTASVSGGDMAIKLSSMVLYLVLWLVLGIFLLPTFLDRTIKYMNDEMLVIVSLGICLGMVLLANYLGFSSALGAFLSGSLLAGTVHVERVEKLTKPIKDMFGAVFFVSVGMMVSPSMIAKYIVPILIITVVTLVGKIIFNSLGMLLAGQSLESSIKGGFALAQIGEFAFIIAGLGSSLGLTDQFLYPIMVAVSVMTTFTTPICIKLAPKFYGFLERVLPESLVYSSETEAIEKDREFLTYVKKYAFRVLVYGALMVMAASLCTYKLAPLIPGTLGKIVGILGSYLAIALFAGPMLNLHNSLYTSLWLKGKVYRLPLTVMNLIKYVIIAAIAMMPLRVHLPVPTVIIAGVMAIVLIVISRKSFMATWYLNLETRFLKNFNERLLSLEQEEEWLDEKLYIFSFFLETQEEFFNKKLVDIEWGKKFNLNVVKVRRGDKQYLMPPGNFQIKKGDKLYLIGEKNPCKNFYKRAAIPKTKPLRTLKQFMESGYEDVEHALAVCPIKLNGEEAFCGKSIKQGNIKSHWHCIIIGIQKDGYPMIMPDPNLSIRKGDIIWIMGSNNNVGRIVSDYIV
ncbi:MAG: cation:proton antiporter [Clostridia bacterium]|nr:cation:proton antiporter [Clostridia bacterium]